MLQLEEAVARILASVPAAGGELLRLSRAHGRMLSARILAAVDLPIFDNSAVDGYAVRSSDVATAAPGRPVRLLLAGRVAAGEPPVGELSSGGCIRLFTGSPLPGGADAVVMQEDTRIEPSAPEQVRILEAVRPWDNVRLRGEDIRRGTMLAGPGEVLTVGRVAVLSAAGVAEVEVGRRPVVGVLATGSELREPGAALAPGQIYESIRAGLSSLIERAGGIPKVFPLVPDAMDSTRLALEKALAECAVLVTCGGVSVGEMDFIKAAFEQLGGSIQFWKVAMKPGRPFTFGRLRDKWLFGLPGNPVSALVTFLLLVRPAVLRWQGAADVTLPTFTGVLAEPLVNDGPRRHFMRVVADSTGRVRCSGLQSSHVLSSFAAANGLVDVPPQSKLPAGTSVQVLRWE